MSFIRKVFEKKIDDSVHLQFQKFSRGEFKNKALVSAKNSKGKYSIGTSHEYANDFIRLMAEKLGNSKAMVTGGVISTLDLNGIIDFSGKKQFMGVKQYVINREMSGREILDICNKVPSAFIALSFKAGGSELKIKAKAPKSAKPSTKSAENQKLKADFCKLTTTDKNLAKEILFDINLEGFKKAEISHDFIIADLILPQGEKDFAKMRELARRKGKIVRKLDVDGMKSQKEAELLA